MCSENLNTIDHLICTCDTPHKALNVDVKIHILVIGLVISWEFVNTIVRGNTKTVKWSCNSQNKVIQNKVCTNTPLVYFCCLLQNIECPESGSSGQTNCDTFCRHAIFSLCYSHIYTWVSHKWDHFDFKFSVLVHLETN